MERYYAGQPGDRYKFVTNESFLLFTTVEGAKAGLVGPREAGVRAISYVIPSGCDGLIVEAAKDAHIECTHMPYRKEDMSGTRYRVEHEIEDPEPVGVFDQVKAALAQLYGQTERPVLPSDKPEDPDWHDGFEVEDEPWAAAHEFKEMEEDPLPDEGVSFVETESAQEPEEGPVSVPQEPTDSDPPAAEKPS